MDLLLICKDGSASSLVSNLLWALEARSAATEAGVLFSSEALATLNSGAFLWPRELASQEWRLAVADAAKAKGLPIALRGEARQLDIHGVLAKAIEAGVPMFADPLWTDLLGLRGNLPAAVSELDAAAGLTLLMETKQIIGSL